MNKNAKKISLGLFCTYVAAVMLLCVIKTDSLPELPKFYLGIPLDKIMHFAMFLPFPILGYMAFYPTEKGCMREFAVLGIMFLLGVGFAFATERLQAMTDYRSYEINDMLADLIGIATGAIIGIIIILKRRK